MKLFNHIEELIGNTALLKLSLFPFPIYAKLEYLNPGGSIKDRSALYMIQQAEKKGLLIRGKGTIIEASSGNQGAATAMIANSRGYKTIITMSEKVSDEKKAIFHAYGAKLVLCKATSDFTDSEHYHQVATKLASSIPDGYFLNQYFNPDNADAHFYGIAHEINQQIGSQMTYLFVAMGSCGSANGIARYMKIHNPKVRVIGVDAGNSFLATQGHPKPYQLDGMGIDYKTPFFDRNLFFDIINVFDNEVHKVLRTLARNHGILVGPSSAGSIAAIKQYQNKLSINDCVVTIFPDSGRSYLSKKYYQE